MQFGDSEAQKLLRNTARSYLSEKFPWDRLYAMERGDETLTEADIKAMADLGWLGLLAPESQDGGGLSLVEAAVVVEELGYAAVPAPIAASNIAAYLLSNVPETAAQKHLVSLAAAEHLYTINETSRRRNTAGDNDTISASGGTVFAVPFADSAAFLLTPVAGADGTAAFALMPLNGATLDQLQLIDRLVYYDVHFDTANVTNAITIARGKDAEELHERSDALVTAFTLIELVGMMKRIMEMTTEYISNRVQFGVPIAKFQAARHRAAELLMQTETTRESAYYALWRFQEDPSDTDEIWKTKHWAIRAAARVYEIVHLLHGGVGVGTDYPVHLYTQGIAAFAVRGGTMNEMVTRTIESMRLTAAG
ncbi:MAG: acyl-CoA/acyl-ACP dehydrogenase [Chloroflexi bacterium]|nr:acyl-CoA/acyl-ACP dehydrogenase [Chloroflexota bacterium]